MVKKHECNKEREIAEIYTMVKDIRDVLRDNGQEGLVTKVNKFEGSFNTVKWIVSLIAVSGLVLGLINMFVS